MLNCTVSDPTQLGVLEGASGAVLGALEGHYVFMCWAPSFLRSARARVTRIPESKRGREAAGDVLMSRSAHELLMSTLTHTTSDAPSAIRVAARCARGWHTHVQELS